MICDEYFIEGDEIVFNRNATVATFTRKQWDRTQRKMIIVRYRGLYQSSGKVTLAWHVNCEENGFIAQ